MLKVIGSPRSRALRVLWLLEEIGEPYEHVPAGPRSPEVFEVSPLGKVPVLVDGDLVVPDSTAIMTYLADKFGKLTCPAGTPDRARQDAATFFLLDQFDAVLWAASRHSFVLPEEHRVPEIKPSLKWEFERSQAQFAAMLGDGPFVMGAAMTIPDIIAAHCGSWAAAAKFPITDASYQAYLDRLHARPALKRAMGG